MSEVNPIERTLVPETPTELLLLARIEELKRGFYEKNLYPMDLGRTLKDYQDHPPTLQHPPPLTLTLAGYSAVEETPEHGFPAFTIMARTRGPAAFGQAAYITSEQYQRLTMSREADLLWEMEKHAFRSLGAKVKEAHDERERKKLLTP